MLKCIFYFDKAQVRLSLFIHFTKTCAIIGFENLYFVLMLKCIFYFDKAQVRLLLFIHFTKTCASLGWLVLYNKIFSYHILMYLKKFFFIKHKSAFTSSNTIKTSARPGQRFYLCLKTFILYSCLNVYFILIKHKSGYRSLSTSLRLAPVWEIYFNKRDIKN
jgi:hypothetical protein